MSMYSLLKYSGNIPVTSGSLQNYHRDEVNDSGNKVDDNNILNNNRTKTKKFFSIRQK